MTTPVLAIIAFAVAIAIMHDHVMRSLRVVLLLTGASVIGMVIQLIGSPPTRNNLIASVIVGAAGLLPVLATIPIAHRAGRLLSSLDPEDLAEHYFIHRAREALRSAAGGRDEEAVLRELEQRPVPHPVWASVRAALIAQGGQVGEMARGHRRASLDDVKRLRAEMMTAWQAAIHARARFFR